MTSPDGTTARHPFRTLVVTVLLIALVIGIFALVRPNFIRGIGNNILGMSWGQACVMQLPGRQVGLSREDAQRAVTSVAMQARGLDGPDTSGIDPAILNHLDDGARGDPGPRLRCRGEGSPSDAEEQNLTSTGLTPRADQVRTAMTEVFGEQPLGGFAPGGITTGHGEDSTHYEGRAIDVFFRPVNEANTRQGWLLAQWLMVHANDLDIQYVIYDDRIWSAYSSRGRWQNYDAPPPGNDIQRHLDHVHVDVFRGGRA